MDLKNIKITVSVSIKASPGKVWEMWTMPDHIKKWCFANEEWHVPYAENNLTVGGRFVTRMEARDGTMGFDFGGAYEEIRNNEYIRYSLDDNRKVEILFSNSDETVTVTETFDPESMNPVEMQKAGWQAILNNFEKYAEMN